MTDDNNIILDIKGKSEDDFEKNITYISAGTLVLSLTFIEKIVSLKEAGYIWALKWSWICLAVTLLVNLGSHQLASWFGDQNYLDKINSDPKYGRNVNRRNNIMRGINIGTIVTLMLGVFFLIHFSVKNAYNMSNTSNQDKGQHTNPITDYEKKGRTYPPSSTGSNTGSTQPGTSSGSTSSGSKDSSSNSNQKKG